MRRIALILSCLLFVGACKDRRIVAPVKAESFKVAQCGGYPKGWRPRGSESGELEIYNKLSLAPSGIQWNGAPIDDDTMRSYLTQVRQLDPSPVTALVIDDTVNCVAVDRLRVIMNEIGQCDHFKPCVEYSRGEWLKDHPPPPY